MFQEASSEAQHHEHERSYTYYDDRDGVVDFEQHIGGLGFTTWSTADETGMNTGLFSCRSTCIPCLGRAFPASRKRENSEIPAILAASLESRASGWFSGTTS